MLYVIEGPAGSGKTKKAYDLLTAGAAEHKDRNYILVVPEQYSISAQKDIVEMSPGKGIINIDILSFQRLAHRIFEVSGGEASDLIDDSGKNLIIRRIADELIPELRVMGSNIKKTGYISEVRSVISELMQYGIGPEELPELEEKIRPRSYHLSSKLHDISLIYKRFTEYLGDSFMTREELLVNAAKRCKDAPFIKNSTFIFDAFTGFTPVQYTFMEALLTHCRDIYVCVGYEKGRSIFGLGEKTKKHLEDMAEHHGGLNVIELSGDKRHDEKSDISLLGSRIFTGCREILPASDGSVRGFKADGPYAEVREVMRRITHLVRDEGYRFRDCGIIMGDETVYADIVTDEAARYGIPVYVDRTRHIMQNPFTELIRALLLMIRDDYSYDSVFHFLRSYLTDIDPDTIDLAENYILAMGIRGRKRYEKPFDTAFRGVSEASMEKAESIRQMLPAILGNVFEREKKSFYTIAEWVEDIRDICRELEVERKLSEYAKLFDEAGDGARSQEYSRIYDLLGVSFDNMVSLIGDQKTDAGGFLELFEDALCEIRVGVIPPKSDVVMAGDLRRSRFSHIKALFFIGMTEGSIPQTGKRGGLISDGDREILEESGAEVAPTAAEDAGTERFYFYMDLMQPEKTVCFSYPTISLDGATLRESYFMKEARRICGIEPTVVSEGSFKGVKDIFTADLLQDAYAASLRADAGKASALGKALAEISGKEVKDRILQAMQDEEVDISLSKEAGEVLFGSSFIESPTELESFAACPYKHFLSYGLSLSERRSFDIERRDIGSLVHKVMEIYSNLMATKERSFRTVTDAESADFLSEALQRAGDERTKAIASQKARYSYLIERVGNIASRSIDTLRFQASSGSFDGIYYEKRFNAFGFRGSIDRGDAVVLDSDVYVSVIDYKTGNKSFDPNRIYYGLDIQLPVYMKAAMELKGAENKDLTVRPGGLFYYRVSDPLLDRSMSDLDRYPEDEVKNELRLDGVVNAKPEVISAFDASLGAGDKSLVIPVTLKKDGTPDARAKVYTEEEFTGMMEHTVALSKDLRQRMVEGDISKTPYSLGSHTGCEYCAYSAICRGGKKRRLEKLDFPEAWHGIH